MSYVTTAVSVFVLFYLSLTNTNTIGKKNKMWGGTGWDAGANRSQGILATLALKIPESVFVF